MNSQSVTALLQAAWIKSGIFLLSEPHAEKTHQDIEHFIWVMKRIIISGIVAMVLNITFWPLGLLPEMQYLQIAIGYCTIVCWLVYVAWIFFTFTFNTNSTSLVTRLAETQEKSRIIAYRATALLTLFGFLVDPLFVLVLGMFVIIFTLSFETSLRTTESP